MNLKNEKTIISDSSRLAPYGKKLLDFFYCSVLVFAFFTSALWITWWPLSHYDFGYSIAYKLLSIDQTIEHYGPLNKYRQHFEQTSRDEHERLFKEIVKSIQHEGKGLSNIVYHDPAGHPIATLLREPEIKHLIDVSKLVSDWQRWGGVALPLSVILGLARRKLFTTMFSPEKIVRTASVGFIVCTTLTLLSGPTKIFYFLHERWFPPKNQWFFYYEESLMTTLMKAPDLFGWIAAEWVALSLMFLSIAWWLWGYTSKRRGS